MAVAVFVCVLFALFSLLNGFVKASNDSPGTLVLAQVLFRHGDRSPVVIFPNDQHKDSWPQGLGQLSKIGLRQQYHLGQFLRHRYSAEHNLLNGTYINSQIRVRSTDVDRTLMSAYSNLAGLYPPSGSQKWDDKILWQPIPVHTVPTSDDKLLNEDIKCPTATRLYEKALNSPEARAVDKENKGFYEYVSTYTGVHVAGLSDVWQTADTLQCEVSHNFSLPHWAQRLWNHTESSVFEKLRELSAYEFFLKYDCGHTLARLRGGPLLKEMIHNMDAAIVDAGKSSHSRTKLFMYSAHDSTVAPLLGALKVYDRLMPPYAAAVLVELYNASGSYSVQLHYRNDSSKEPTPLHIPGCTEFCPYDKFLALTSDMIPVDWDAECWGPSHNDRERLMMFLAIGMAVVSLVMLMLGVGLIIVCVARRKRCNQGYRGLSEAM